MTPSSLSPSEYIATLLLVPSAVLCFRKAPSVALALLLSFIANLAYLHASNYPNACVSIFGVPIGEWMRWVSAIVGLAGAYEFGRGAERTKHRIPVSIPDALRKVDGGAWIGIAALASMGVDGLGLLLYRKAEVWVVPEMTIGILVLVGLLGAFGRKG